MNTPRTGSLGEMVIPSRQFLSMYALTGTTQKPTADTPATIADTGAYKGKRKTSDVPHEICYTVAGMPRGGVDGATEGSNDRRGPREGKLTAYSNWNLRDLKVRWLSCVPSFFQRDLYAEVRSTVSSPSVSWKFVAVLFCALLDMKPCVIFSEDATAGSVVMSDVR